MPDPNKGNRLIFVGGSPRSGTTLVQNILDSHPEILGGPEFLCIPEIIKLRRRLHVTIGNGWIDMYCSYDSADQQICAIIENFLLPFADKHKTYLLSEKTPENILFFIDLIQLFPSSHFIHVVRDPRAIASSMLEVGKRARNKGLKPPPFTVNISASIAYIKKCLNAGFAASKTAPAKVLTVPYERLVSDPKLETKRICEFLGIEWAEDMITPGKQEHLGEKAITCKSNELWYDVKSYRRDPERQGIEKWKKMLTLFQQTRISMAFEGYKELEQLGYDFSVDGVTQPKRILFVNHTIFMRLGIKLAKYISILEKSIPGLRRLRRLVFRFFRL